MVYVYMVSNKNDSYYIGKILDDLTFIVKHMEGTDKDKLYSNELLLDSMMFRLIQVSENARRLTEGYKDKRSSVPWTAIYGLRNRIVHDYGSVDLEIVYSTLKEDVPDLLEILKKEE